MSEQDTDSLLDRIEELEEELLMLTANKNAAQTLRRENLARAEVAEAALPRAYRMGLEDAEKIAKASDPSFAIEMAEAIRSVATPTDLVERVIKKSP